MQVVQWFVNVMTEEESPVSEHVVTKTAEKRAKSILRRMSSRINSRLIW